MKNHLSLPAVCVYLLACPLLLAAEPTLDEWSDPDVVAEDPAGDASDVFDLTRVSAITRGTTLYLHFDTGRRLNLQNGPETEGTLRLSMDVGEDGPLNIDFRGRSYLSDTCQCAAPNHHSSTSPLLAEQAWPPTTKSRQIAGRCS
jgi:hypothetical protein